MPTKFSLDTVSNSLIAAWRAHPSLAARDLLYNPLSSNEDDKFTLIPIQRIVINRIWQATNSIVVGCRGFGKTYSAATIAILKALLYPGRRVGTLSASFRQSKQIFEEIQNIWNRSPILQACTERSPVIANDSCRLVFKTVAGHNPSIIIALPLADGQRIRGSRMHTLLLDEANIISRDTFDTVLRPFAATAQEPVKQVRLFKKIKEIEARTDLLDYRKQEMVQALKRTSTVNEIMMFLSGYYSYNWVYSLYCKYSNRMHGIKNSDDDLDDDYSADPTSFATFQVPYQSLPDNFLSKSGLDNARKDMNSIQFRCEYEAAWISDSGGFFSIQEIDSCRAENMGVALEMRPFGDPAKDYIMAIDPARTRDAFAILVGEIDPELGLKIVHIEQHFRVPTPQMVARVFLLLSRFNVIEVGMDRGGGGQTAADFLAHGTPEFSPIFDKDEPMYRGMRGRHILRLVDFGTNWIEGANHNSKFLMERRRVIFPRKSLEGANSDKKLDELDRYSQIIEQLIMQLISIQVSETRTGKAHFDLPESGGGYTKHKDLYSAFLILCDMYFNRMQTNLLPKSSMPLLGIITPRVNQYGYGANFF